VEKFPPPAELSASAHVKSHSEYQVLYERSLKDPDGFWREKATELLDWSTPFHTVQREGEHGIPGTQWFLGGKLNACFNAVDRHAAAQPDKIALLFENNDGKTERKITYKQLHEEVQRAANALKALGIGKGDVVVLYMPPLPETVVAMLACARIGAVHNVCFAGFSETALRERIASSAAKLVITTDGMHRGAKTLPLKATVDHALEEHCETIKHTLVVRRTGAAVEWKDGRDLWWHDEVSKAAPHCDAVPMDSEDPLFVLFTSGSTGKPKGLVHTTGGYLTYAATTARYAFDLRPEDVYFCGADIGWVTGHTYLVYAPLLLGVTSVLYEGHMTHPSESQFWSMIQRYKITVFYTSPTAVRALMSLGEGPLKGYDRSSLRVLGSVGEPIGEAAWRWLHKHVGGSKAPIIDTYWQTETGGIILCPLPGATHLKPGSAAFPFFGVELGLFDEKGNEVPHKEGQESSGLLCIKRAWPGLARSILNNPARYKAAYFPWEDRHPRGLYVTGDQARRDAEGFYWISGRVDDVVNVSGHRISSAEVESALGQHKRTAESAVVSMPHALKGECLVAFVCVKADAPPQAAVDFARELRALVAKDIGKLAVPDQVLVIPALPKTRSGKIMRRLLRQIVHGKTDAQSLGDTSTLAEPQVVEQIIKQCAKEIAPANPKAKL